MPAMSLQREKDQLLALNELLIQKVRVMEGERVFLRKLTDEGLAMGAHGSVHWREALESIQNMLSINLNK